MMEKLSASEFDENYKRIKEKLNETLIKIGKSEDDITL